MNDFCLTLHPVRDGSLGRTEIIPPDKLHPVRDASLTYIIHKENIKSINHKEHKEITQSTLRNQDFVNFVNLAKRSHESKPFVSLVVKKSYE